MSFIQSHGATIYYEESGAGEPLILLPGLLGTIDSHWRRFIPELRKYFHTIAVDLRGHGRTNNPSCTLSLRAFIQDVETLCDALEIERAHICGYSLGGYIGLAYGLEYPRRVATLAMHGTKFYWTPAAINATLGTLDPGTILAKIPGWAEALQKEHAPGNGENGWKDLLAASAGFIQAMNSNSLKEEQLRRIGFPVCVSVCDADEMIPIAEAERLAAAIPHAQLHIETGCTHPFRSVPRSPFAERVLAFLSMEQKPL